MEKPSATKIAFASFIGTAIEFYDFYIYAMAAALVIGQVFFPESDPAVQTLNAFLTFGLAFIARPFGALLFGHFGDKVGRKTTLAASLLVMGISTLLIGLLPGYDTLGFWAPLTLCILRFGQGVGLGGEWGGAALLATEHAPKGRRGWFGMFPQLGPSVGFLLATLSFLGLSLFLTDAQFKSWGWRLPFIFSAVLVGVGLYIRFKLAETPAFAKALAEQATHAVPVKQLLKTHLKPVLLGALAMVVCYNLFYTAAVFCLSYGTKTLGGFAMSPLMGAASTVSITLFLSLALLLMGATFAPMGAYLPEQFPVAVRYTGAGLAYQLGGILGASFAPSASQWLAVTGGLSWVGYYVSAMAVVSVVAVFMMRETAHH